MLRLANRVAIVTGGSGGIGRAVCETFLKNGASVAVVDLKQGAIDPIVDLLTKNAGPNQKVFGVSCDVASPKSVQEATDAIQSALGSAHVLVNAAGITKDEWSVRMTPEQFDAVINVNLKGSFLMSQAVVRQMLSAKVVNGSLINISSIVGKVGNLGQVNYAASKAGVIGMTKSMAKELAPNGIRCNAVLPGFIKTQMTAAVPDKVMAKVLQLVPMGQMGEPSDIADACLFLASADSRYVTGTTLEVAGGLFC
eukprot:comp17094_c0_seq1/m.15850 comp17094_c0_seq1/g.15850  ORF comp17094_c0_seq1/g.15850 comp17094_c0_seq1/m.15850 type:complete len:253 (-) comp17094_c0_seq1:36-794(-)